MHCGTSTSYTSSDDTNSDDTNTDDTGGVAAGGRRCGGCGGVTSGMPGSRFCGQRCRDADRAGRRDELEG